LWQEALRLLQLRRPHLCRRRRANWRPHLRQPASSPLSSRKTKSIASSRKKCAGTTITMVTGIAAGITVTGTAVGIVATGAITAIGENARVHLSEIRLPNKKPRFLRSGVFILQEMRRSDRTAASVAPRETERAAAAGNDHHRPLDHDSAGRHHHGGTTVGTAFPIGIGMPAGAAAACRARAADPCKRRCNQCSREKILHVISLLLF
jgi:hypothetical protein